ncbi:MAG: HAMP domain-containing sensor histidine kinase [Acidimicrobiales bacterium]|nr:HAMP domain-containing sensor histidine kinase [Acidimicrobiales bacterium]MDG2219040.1 HAMP domain-containing sensor histidine kinase [Acidimicrobiales bacterium]
MTLRAQIALLVASVVTVVVGVVGVSVHRSAEAELVEEVDLELLQRGSAVSGAGRGGRGFGAPDELSDFQKEVSGRTFVRLLSQEGGHVLFRLGDEFEAPSSQIFLAAADEHATITFGMIGEDRARVVTIVSEGRGYVQIARSLAEIDQSLADLRNRILVIGSLSVVAAAVLASMLAARTAAPIMRLTVAAEAVANTGDLDQPVDGAGGDEVGRLASSFNAMLGALSWSKRQQHQLVMDASHELRTPLTSLRMNVDLLRGGSEISADVQTEIMGDIDAELGELSEMVAELVDLAADVRTDEELSLVTLSEIAEPVIERARRRTGRDILLTATKNTALEARPNALSRAIRNLIDNAAKFSPAGSPIEVVIDGGSFTVNDAGPGIPSNEWPLVWDRFHRVESSRALPGSGLGLAIVHQVVDAHGGSVRISDSPTGGAAVGFSVPTIDD